MEAECLRDAHGLVQLTDVKRCAMRLAGCWTIADFCSGVRARGKNERKHEGCNDRLREAGLIYRSSGEVNLAEGRLGIY